MTREIDLKLLGEEVFALAKESPSFAPLLSLEPASAVFAALFDKAVAAVFERRAHMHRILMEDVPLRKRVTWIMLAGAYADVHAADLRKKLFGNSVSQGPVMEAQL